jgi:quercetin dioxygenase-like cupin family protein
MSDITHLQTLAAALVPWKSSIIGKVGPANIKLVNMSHLALAEEDHPYDEAVFVIDGVLVLEMQGRRIEIRSGEFFLIGAGLRHRIADGSRGTLLLVDL